MRWLAPITAILALVAPSGCALFPFDAEGRPASLAVPGPEVRVPMTLVKGVPLVEVRLEGEGPWWFMIDTGSFATLVDTRVAERIDLPSRIRYGTIVGGAGREFRTMVEGRLGRLEIGEAVFRDFEVLVSDLADFSRTLEHPVDGIIGMPVLEQCTWCLDYPRRTVTLLPDALPPPDGRTRWVLDWKDGHALIVIRLDGHEFPAILDTGSSSGISLREEDAELVADRLEILGEAGVQTITGPLQKPVARVDGLVHVGPVPVDDPLVMIARHALVGGGFLRHFVLCLDVRQRTIELRASDD